MTKTPAQFRRHLDHLTAEYALPEGGFFRPDGLVWQVNRERILRLGGLRAILMQLAHPRIAQGVAEHSRFQKNPLGRYLRTMRVVQDILFGRTGTVLRQAARVYAIHDRVRGTISERSAGPSGGTCPRRYVATDPDLLMWVYATLLDSLVFTHDTLFQPLGEEKWDQLYREGQPFAYLFGIPQAQLPPDFAAFRSYVAAAAGQLQVTETARRLADQLLGAPAILLRPMNQVMAGGTLPDFLRAEYRIAWTRKHQLIFRLGVAALRAGIPLLPSTLRHVQADAERS